MEDDLSSARDPEIFLVRHGQTEWNMEGRFQGQMDSPLTETGQDQAQAVGRQLASILADAEAQMHVSPLGRTRRTADILRRFHAYRPSRLEPRLQEVTLGSWDGLTRSDIEAGWPHQLRGSTHHDWYFYAPTGESYEVALHRVRSWLNGLSGPVVAVSHGLLGRLIRGAYLDLPREEALRLPVSQDVIWHLRAGKMHAIAVPP